MSNDKLESYVTEELHWDPKVDDEAIAVSAEDGIVTLRGTVGASGRSATPSKIPSGSMASRRSRTSSTSGSWTKTGVRTQSSVATCCRR
jgi:BON domain